MSDEGTAAIGIASIMFGLAMAIGLCICLNTYITVTHPTPACVEVKK